MPCETLQIYKLHILFLHIQVLHRLRHFIQYCCFYYCAMFLCICVVFKCLSALCIFCAALKPAAIFNYFQVEEVGGARFEDFFWWRQKRLDFDNRKTNAPQMAGVVSSLQGLRSDGIFTMRRLKGCARYINLAFNPRFWRRTHKYARNFCEVIPTKEPSRTRIN